jgi:hypothetical protein
LFGLIEAMRRHRIMAPAIHGPAFPKESIESSQKHGTGA